MNTVPGWRSRVPLGEEAATLIRERIFSGRYAPGDRLPQAELSRELGLSRTPLREGMRVLEQEGLLHAGPDGSARVAAASAAELRNIYEFREPVESAAARLACSRISPGMLEGLRAIADRQHRELERWREGRFQQLSAQFHTLLLEASGNPLISRQATMVRMAEQVFRPAHGMTAEGASAAAAGHAAVVRAVESRDADAAERAVREHLRAELSLIVQPQGESV